MKPDETQVSASNVMKDTCEKEKIAASALNKGHTTKTVEKTCSDEAAPTIQIGNFEKIAFMFVACLVPLAIILPLVLTRKAPFHAASTVTPTKPPTATQTQAPTVTPTDPPTETRLSMFSTIIGSMFYDQLFPSSLAQGLALAWLAQEDPAYLPVDSEPETLLERFTLVLLYFATRGDNWPYRAGWLSNQHFCDWEGVICNESQHVSELDFYENEMTGTIPTEIGSLTRLTGLWLFSNELTGPIPSEIGALTSLTWLDLSDNFLKGTIPSEIVLLTSLTWLDLADNELTGATPVDIASLTSLENLWLDGNILTGEIPIFNNI